MIPQMVKRGYAPDYAVNVTANAAIIALLIPPSHNMIIYSLAAGGTISIADLFNSRVIPGLMLCGRADDRGLGVAVKRGYPAGSFPASSRCPLFVAAAPGIILIGIIFVACARACSRRPNPPASRWSMRCW